MELIALICLTIGKPLYRLLLPLTWQRYVDLDSSLGELLACILGFGIFAMAFTVCILVSR